MQLSACPWLLLLCGRVMHVKILHKAKQITQSCSLICMSVCTCVHKCVYVTVVSVSLYSLTFTLPFSWILPEHQPLWLSGSPCLCPTHMLTVCFEALVIIPFKFRDDPRPLLSETQKGWYCMLTESSRILKISRLPACCGWFMCSTSFPVVPPLPFKLVSHTFLLYHPITTQNLLLGLLKKSHVFECWL